MMDLHVLLASCGIALDPVCLITTEFCAPQRSVVGADRSKPLGTSARSVFVDTILG